MTKIDLKLTHDEYSALRKHVTSRAGAEQVAAIEVESISLKYISARVWVRNGSEDLFDAWLTEIGISDPAGSNIAA